MGLNHLSKLLLRDDRLSESESEVWGENYCRYVALVCILCI